MTDLRAKRFASAAAHLRAAKERLPALADYISYSLAEALAGLDKHAEAWQQLAAVLKAASPSPLRPQAILLAARSHLALEAPVAAVRLLQENLAQLPAPDGVLLLAQALEANGDPAAAAIHYQRVYYEHPKSAAAASAEAALMRLPAQLGASYPPPMPQAMLSRASLLIEAGDTTKAIAELQQMILQLGGEQRDLARVRIGAARRRARQDSAALAYLNTLEVNEGEAGAERLYLMAACARRLGRDEEVRAAMAGLAERHRTSHWRLEALLAAANEPLVKNQPEIFEPLYRACYEDFPSDPEACGCHWKVTWLAYRGQRPEAATMLQDHLQRFPGSDNIGGALYFLGRLAEARNDPASARAWFQTAAERFPNYYYGLVSRERLAEPALARIRPTAAVAALVNTVVPLDNSTPQAFAPTAPSRLRMERARLLRAAGLEDWADQELRFGARTDAQANVMAVELSEAAARRGDNDRSIRSLRLSGDYFRWPVESVPPRFWRLAFPLPYREALEKRSREQSLDPFLMAGLVRQESAFEAKAVSRAKALGLTQIRPATGRELSGKLGIKGFRTSSLFQPDMNLRLGTYYMNWLLKGLDGKMELALAAYNAGRSRAILWRQWGTFREPAEFIETIPFSETRNYVQVVLRNAHLYRRLYEGTEAAVPSSGGPARDQDSRPASGGRRSTPPVP